MKQTDLENAIKTGPEWWMGILGILLIIFAALAQYGGSEFQDVWALWLGGVFLIWSFRVGEVRLREQSLIKRTISWRKKTLNLTELKWIDFESNNKIMFWIGSDFVRIQPPFWKYKTAKKAASQIGVTYIDYFDYQMVERSSLRRGQVSGCLDCHQTFLPSDLKTWQKLPKSIWWGRKKDQYFTVCPECKGNWVYTNSDHNRPVTKRALEIMDATFEFDEKTKLRKIIGETLTRQTFLQHGH